MAAGLLVAAGLTGAGHGAWAQPTVVACNSLANAGLLEVPGNQRIMGGPCEVTLQQPLTIQGLNNGTLPLKPTAEKGGLVIHLNGHKLTVRDVRFTFDRGFAIDVLGSDSGELQVHNVEIVDQAPTPSDCATGGWDKRFGLIAHRVGQVSLVGLNIRGTGTNPANLQGGLLVVGDPAGANSPVQWTGGLSKVRCGLAATSVRRPMMMNSVQVEVVGPCDLRPPGYRPVVDTGKP